MAVAAVSFAACNKEDITPTVEQGNKSIALSIANLAPTKTANSAQVADNSAVKLNSFQVFFVDGTTKQLYTPKTVDASAEADTYFTTLEEDNIYEFHFLPKVVSEVIVIGNMSEITATNKDELLAAVESLKVEDQQNPTALRLYGIDTQLSAGTTIHPADDPENPAIQHPDPYVVAEVNLVPAMARFEVKGFEYKLAAGKTARDYSEMAVNSLSMRNWYKTATVDFAGAVTPGALDAFATTELNVNNIYGTYFSTFAENAGLWYFDDVKETTLAAANEWKSVSETTCFAYQVFPGEEVPQFLIELTGKEGGVSSPLYLMTSSLKTGSGETAAALAEVEAGKIYRMTMSFDDGNLQEPEKCIQVKISVEPWAVVLITPEF